MKGEDIYTVMYSIDKEYACRDFKKARLLGIYIEDMDEYCKPNWLDSLTMSKYDYPMWSMISTIALVLTLNKCLIRQQIPSRKLKLFRDTSKKWLTLKTVKKQPDSLKMAVSLRFQKRQRTQYQKANAQKQNAVELWGIDPKTNKNSTFTPNYYELILNVCLLVEF